MHSTTPLAALVTAAGRDWMVCTAADFSEISPLGRGAFGKVLFVKHKVLGFNYALKAQVRLISYNQVR